MSTPTRLRLRDIAGDPTLALMLALAYGTGLPIRLIFSTQSIRLREAGVPIELLTMFSWVLLCYSLKFLWSPLIDWVDVPLLAPRLGRRRAWLLVSQLGVVAGLLGLGFADPGRSLAVIVALSVFTAFAGATQDIVVDGWRIDAAPAERQGIMAAAYQLGYALAVLTASAGALYIAQFASWKAAYVAMAALMLVGIVTGLASPRLPDRAPAIGAASEAGAKGLRSSFVVPLVDLARRFGVWLAPMLLLVALFRLPDFLTGVVANPLYVDLGFQKSEIATVTKVWGVWIGIGGAFVGGISVARLGLFASQLIRGIAAASWHITLPQLAASGHRLDLLTLSVSMESFAGSFAGTALIAYMSSLVSPAMAASQYALLSSLYALPGKILGGYSGTVVVAVGYSTFFLLSSTIGIPVALLCLAIWGRDRIVARRTRSAEPNLDEAAREVPGEAAIGPVPG